MPKPEFEFTPIDSVEYRPCDPHVDGLSEAVLAGNSKDGTVTRILKFEPGTDTSSVGPLQHPFWEEVFIFDGSFVDVRLGKEFKAGSWATRPPGMIHGPWISQNGARMFEVRYYAREEADE